MFLFVGAAAPDASWWGYLMAALLFVCLITWNVLTTRWFLSARSGATPTPWFRELVTTLPSWAKILLTLLSAPIVFGVLAIFHRNGVNIPVLIAGLTGLVIALRFYRHHMQGAG
ncbi:MAG: hypothetical protein ACRDTE_06965 [Pseudonocardiaceae bacterium]